MAEEQRSGGPPRSEHSNESQYPPPPGEEDDRARGIPYHPRPPMAGGTVTLPSIQDPSGPYGAPPTRGWDPHASNYGSSPNSTNGYPTPSNAGPNHHNVYSSSSGGSAYPPPLNHQYLPPVQQHATDARSHYPPQDPRAAPYYSAQRPMPPYGTSSYDFTYRPDRVPSGGYPQDYARTPQAMQQQAPRQRTSIACKYCRRRKIRCSGYANSPGGKCTNCIKMTQECVFQPVSSSASTAFVPVSALQNGIPPGTPLYGAYGQPINGPSNIPPHGPYQATTPQYEQPLPSPTGSFGSYHDERAEVGRRRQRPPEDEHSVRLPPPNTFPDENVRRRSPSSSGSPNHLAPYQTQAAQSGQQSGYETRTPPPRGSPSGPSPSGASANSVMSLGNIIDSNDIDRGMLSRLNQQKK